MNINIETQEFSIPSTHGLSCAADLRMNGKNPSKKLIIFSHGFKGFKDWGSFSKMADEFVNQGFSFLKFNFSLNGISSKSKTDFDDLEVFKNNTYSQEMDDLQSVISFLKDSKENKFEEINLLGHSRGGAITLLTGYQIKGINKICTWASPNDLGWSWKNQELVEKWKLNGVMFSKNKRTGQNMPLGYGLYEDFLTNQDKFSIKKAIQTTDHPILIVHGSEDEAVNLENALQIKRWNPAISLEIIPSAGHTFGSKHPFEEDSLPIDLQFAINHTISFFRK